MLAVALCAVLRLPRLGLVSRIARLSSHQKDTCQRRLLPVKLATDDTPGQLHIVESNRGWLRRPRPLNLMVDHGTLVIRLKQLCPS